MRTGATAAALGVVLVLLLGDPVDGLRLRAGEGSEWARPKTGSFAWFWLNALGLCRRSRGATPITSPQLLASAMGIPIEEAVERLSASGPPLIIEDLGEVGNDRWRRALRPEPDSIQDRFHDAGVGIPGPGDPPVDV